MSPARRRQPRTNAILLLLVLTPALLPQGLSWGGGSGPVCTMACGAEGGRCCCAPPPQPLPADGRRPLTVESGTTPGVDCPDGCALLSSATWTSQGMEPGASGQVHPSEPPKPLSGTVTVYPAGAGGRAGRSSRAPPASIHHQD